MSQAKVREVQCFVCLQYSPINIMNKGFLTVKNLKTDMVQWSSKVYTCSLEHLQEIEKYYGARLDCTYDTTVIVHRDKTYGVRLKPEGKLEAITIDHK